ncbi:hypothetical protein Psta_0709 [Pirellula staleyi DSM 6068]|uniref:Uncharacterized protein n=1 Tax=Pirellula staleyi (strain ATCC 27377 / DSM 6068 / ICPB 4128) TaxID=530564 RepID=D2R5D6_PIRSD|nr:hypothetical protein [Pirellula staleyi]ADB15395.1 hypothetical protein Psta_0709 [Pirellula staleyi DSM 6068]
MSLRHLSWAMLTTLALGLVAPALHAQEAAPAAAEAKTPTAEELIKNLEKELTGMKLTGRFTTIGKEGGAKEESYVIHKATKMPDGNLWMLSASMNEKTKIPVPIDIEWAGTTPILSMTEMAIPGLGTFSCRVVLYDGMYAGTWRHGKVTGHLFGTMEKLPVDEKPEAKPAPK